MPAIITFDPGLKTGVNRGSYEKGQEPVLEESKELDMHEVIPYLRAFLLQHPEGVIVVERFIINMQTAKKTQAPFTLELIGAIKQVLRDHGRDTEDIIFQAPSDAMKLFPNPTLKKLGYWHVGGKDHANDSIRHFLLYCLRKGWKPTKLLT